MISSKASVGTLTVSEPGAFESRSYRKILTTLRNELSDKEIEESLHTLEDVFYKSNMVDDWTQEYRLRVEEVFASPLYSDGLKKYCAAARIHSELMFLVADRFLTEEIIFSRIIGWASNRPMSRSYVTAMMKSVHLSERIIEAVLMQAGVTGKSQILEITPDALITPKVIKNWISYSDYGWKPDSIRIASKRIKRVHPDYEGCPDEWVLKVFCGE